MRVAHLSSHPVQYFAPLYKELERSHYIEHVVYYYSDCSLKQFRDDGFSKDIVWDIPLLEGYKAKFCPSSKNKKICDKFIQMPNLDIIRETAFGRYDVIWIHGYAHPNAWLVAIASFLSGTKVLIREEQTLLDGRPWHKLVLKSIMLRLLFKFTYGLYIGENNRQYFEHYGMRSSRLFPSRYCVDNDFFRKKAEEMAPLKKDIRSGFGISDDSPVILFAGKFIEKKQPLLLIEAFARLRREMPCWLLFAGDGPLREAMEDWIYRQNVPGVVFSGFLNQTEIPRAYAAADIFVLPSGYMETWGLVVNEAMNFSLPVVVTDKVGCAADLVRDGWNGYVVNHRSVDALKSALERLICDPGLRKNFGRRSLELVSGYSIRSCADEIVAACFAVCGRSRMCKGSQR